MPFCRPKCCASLAHPVPQTAVLYGSHTKDTHKSTEWKTGHTAQPLFAPQALTRRRWHGWLQEVRHLLYFRFSAGCCLAAVSACLASRRA